MRWFKTQYVNHTWRYQELMDFVQQAHEGPLNPSQWDVSMFHHDFANEIWTWNFLREVHELRWRGWFPRFFSANFLHGIFHGWISTSHELLFSTRKKHPKGKIAFLLDPGWWNRYLKSPNFLCIFKWRFFAFWGCLGVGNFQYTEATMIGCIQTTYSLKFIGCKLDLKY